ncbi:MAG: serine hydrolase domain-containing protein [Nocardioides sp.]
MPDTHDGELGSRLDATLARVAEAANAPGAQAALLRDGDVAWIGTYGVADAETGTPVTESTVFCLASLGKTLVATIALRLVEEGRLDLDTPIASVLGDEVPGTGTVTPRMLLAHTSGYPDLYETPAIAALMAHDEDEPGSGEAFDPDRRSPGRCSCPGSSSRSSRAPAGSTPTPATSC